MTPREHLDLGDPFRVDVLLHIHKGLLAQGLYVSLRELNRCVSRAKSEFGDYAFHAHKAARVLGKPAEKVAQELAQTFVERKLVETK